MLTHDAPPTPLVEKTAGMDPSSFFRTHLLDDADQTLDLAARFAGVARPGTVVLLSGPLGAGKTLFVRGFCAGLGMRDLYEVDSPTYTVCNHYDVGPGVDHLDLYRLNGPDDLEELDFDGLLADSGIKLIEWPERLGDHPLGPVYLVRFTVTGPQSRTVTISAVPGTGS